MFRCSYVIAPRCLCSLSQVFFFGTLQEQKIDGSSAKDRKCTFFLLINHKQVRKNQKLATGTQSQKSFSVSFQQFEASGFVLHWLPLANRPNQSLPLYNRDASLIFKRPSLTLPQTKGVKGKKSIFWTFLVNLH